MTTQNITGKISNIDIKQGINSKGQNYTLSIITIEDKLKFSTFNTEIPKNYKKDDNVTIQSQVNNAGFNEILNIYKVEMVKDNTSPTTNQQTPLKEYDTHLVGFVFLSLIKSGMAPKQALIELPDYLNNISRYCKKI